MSVTAIIPAFNEEKYIGGVLEPLLEIRQVTQVIVVSDGSTDGTVAEAGKYGVEVIELPDNIGKGGAMSVGYKASREEYILFLDADLLGLTGSHILELIEPVLHDEADMTIGIFENGRLSTDMAQFIAPFLSGQRCIKKSLLQQFKGWEDAGFGVEAALTIFAQEHNLRIRHITLPAMSHVMKEEKMGLVRGFTYRLKMYWEIAKKVRPGG